VDFAKIDSTYEQLIDQTFIARQSPPSPEAALMDGVLDGEVQQAIDRLPEEYRIVVLLALVEEMSYKEISSALSIPLGTVMSRLHRGRKLLQADLVEFAARKGILGRQAGVAAHGDSK